MFSSSGAPKLGFVLRHSKCLDVVWVQPLRTQRTPTGDDVGEAQFGKEIRWGGVRESYSKLKSSGFSSPCHISQLHYHYTFGCTLVTLFT